MTQRTLPPEKSRTDLATHDVIEHMNEAITANHRAHAITTPEEHFRRTVAAYLFSLSWPDMCHLLRIEPQTEDADLLATLANKGRIR
jgi:hypothetical protein